VPEISWISQPDRDAITAAPFYPEWRLEQVQPTRRGTPLIRKPPAARAALRRAKPPERGLNRSAKITI
jgi:hypothetical protein